MTSFFDVRRLAAVIALAPSLLAQAPPSTPDGERRPIKIGHHREIKSEILGETRHLMISLPSDYEKRKGRCGVVYLLDGGSFFATTVAAVRHNARTHLPLIVVGIQNTDRTRDLTPPAAKKDGTEAMLETAGGATRFRRFLLEELRPFLSKNYRTNDLSILIGHSLGGLFVFDTLVNHSDSFTAYFCMSPSLWWDDEALVKKLEDIKPGHEMFDQFAYFSAGDEASSMNPAFEKVVWHYKERAPHDCRWHVARFPGKDHWTVASPSVYEGFMGFFKPIRAIREDRSITSFAELKGRYDDLTKLFGVTIKPRPNVAVRMAHRLSMEGRVDEALAFLDAAQASFPDALHLALARGHVLAEAERFEEAIQCLEEAAKKASNERAFLVSLVKGALNDIKTKQAAKAKAKAGKRP